MQQRNRTYRKICQYCGKEFLACQARTAYCSERCAKLAVKLKYKNERLKRESAEVREFERLALLDKNYLTLSDAAKLMQISRNTLYKIIQLYSIQLQRFTDRTVRIARADLEKAGLSNFNYIKSTVQDKDDVLTNRMTREQVMEKYGVTHSWFYSTIKKHNLSVIHLGSKAFYDKEEMERLFKDQNYSNVDEWYTFDQLRQETGMRTESICDFCKTYKIPRTRKNGIVYVSRKHWDESRGANIDPKIYMTVKEITETYKLSRNHLFIILRDNGVERIKRGIFVYFKREEIAKVLKYREEKLKQI